MEDSSNSIACTCTAQRFDADCPQANVRPTQRLSNWNYCPQGHPFHYDQRGYNGNRECPECGLEMEK